MELGIENSWYSKQQMQRPLNVYPQKGKKVRAGKGVRGKLREMGSSHITKGTECQNSAFELYSKVKCKPKNTIEKNNNGHIRRIYWKVYKMMDDCSLLKEGETISFPWSIWSNPWSFFLLSMKYEFCIPHKFDKQFSLPSLLGQGHTLLATLYYLIEILHHRKRCYAYMGGSWGLEKLNNMIKVTLW